MVVHHAANVHRLAQVSVAEPMVERLQRAGIGGVDVDAVAVFVAVVQAGQRRVKRRCNLTAIEDLEGGLCQHLGRGPETDVAFAEEAVL